MGIDHELADRFRTNDAGNRRALASDPLPETSNAKTHRAAAGCGMTDLSPDQSRRSTPVSVSTTTADSAVPASTYTLCSSNHSQRHGPCGSKRQ
jgi:hypothetical protein